MGDLDFWLRDGDGALVCDLFGDPVPARRGMRGRPAHAATAENRARVTLWLAMGKDDEAIADGLGVSMPTLRKHYFSELSRRRSAAMRLEGKILSGLVCQFEGGNTAAGKELLKRLDRREMRELARNVAERGTREPAKGKKEKARDAAAMVSGKFAPPPAPLLN